jgi:hypothetical protein
MCSHTKLKILSVGNNQLQTGQKSSEARRTKIDERRRTLPVR